ncbi:MAG: cytochrome C [Bacteroidetes bacterium]|nr:cytochrome C [Bacteroidota bacterium]
MKLNRIVAFVFLMAFYGSICYAQISPGELSSYHSHLEGISNCTQCHILGEKLSNDKCLGCHTELKERVSQNKGYHSSVEVKGKQCATCHSDHHGKSFQIVKFDEKKFNHNLSGFPLIGAHSKKTCKDCHNIKHIMIPKIITKKFTYLGLKTNCVNCHIDYHQGTLSTTCTNCHDANGFKPASKFNHTSAKFQLTGKHKNVDCVKCHKIDTKNNLKFQHFTGLQFSNCTNCHTDPHKNKFGPNCMDCHSGESFTASTKGMKGFDHSKTQYKLEEKHLNVDCKLCHKVKYTTPIKHEKCFDCHKDYHNKQFAKEGVSPDCAACHNLSGFVNFSYTIEQHNKSEFVLQGAHLALPCLDCHKKTEKWMFKEIGKKCVDCHKNIHADLISKKYYPEDNCLSCHSVNKWSEINFDHSKTNFKLSGEHKTQTCRKCHFKENADGTKTQKFANLAVVCTNCHVDKHYKQFDKEGVTDCNKCHEFDNWKPVKFDHNNTAFKLDGKHSNVLCIKCHKPKEINNNKYIIYKISTKCESCHS